MTEKFTPNPQWVIEALGKIVAANPVDVIAAISDPTDPRSIPDRLKALPDSVKFAISAIKFGRDGPSIQMHSKTAAIELIGKALAMWTDRLSFEQPYEPVKIPEGASLEERANIWAQMLHPNRKH
jgi:hypothetical protein